MGKGKGSFEFWATRCVLLRAFISSNIGLQASPDEGSQPDASYSNLEVRQFGRNLPAKASVGFHFFSQDRSLIPQTLALREAADKLPSTYEFISRSSPPRLGRLLIHPDPPNPPDAL